MCTILSIFPVKFFHSPLSRLEGTSSRHEPAMGATSGREYQRRPIVNRACAGPAPARVSNTSGGEWARHRILNSPGMAAPAWTLLVNSRTARRLHNTEAQRRRRRRVGTRCPSEARSTAATPQRAVGSGTGTTGSALPEGAAHLWALFSRRRAVSVDGQESRPRGLGLGVPRLSTRAAPRTWALLPWPRQDRRRRHLCRRAEPPPRCRWRSLSQPLPGTGSWGLGS